MTGVRYCGTMFHVAQQETQATLFGMLKGQDILVLLHLLGRDDLPSVRSIGDAVDLDPAGVHRALGRLREVHLVDQGGRPNRANAEEFLLHGAKYLFPISQGGLSRGVPTAWAAPPLRDEVAESSGPPPVWPSARGAIQGVSLEPIHPSAEAAGARDDYVGAGLALLDAIRLGDGRIKQIAARRLSKLVREP